MFSQARICTLSPPFLNVATPHQGSSLEISYRFGLIAYLSACFIIDKMYHNIYNTIARFKRMFLPTIRTIKIQIIELDFTWYYSKVS